MTDMVPTGLGFHSSHLPNSFGSSRHVGYIVHGQHEVKIAHKCDAFDSADAATLTPERECLQLPPPPPPPPGRWRGGRVEGEAWLRGGLCTEMICGVLGYEGC